MKLRLVLAIQLLVSLVVLAGFVTFTEHVLWRLFAPSLPEYVQYGTDVIVHTQYVFFTYGISFILLTALVLLLLYLELNREVIRPVKAITTAMAAFAESRTFEPFSKVSLSIAEVRELVHVFTEFADSVEEVHEKDMEISRVKSDFISTAAHQFRTPLTGIRWALEALQKETLTEEQKALVENALAKSHDLVSIVGMLLDITSIESGKHKYTFAPVSLPQVASEAIADFQNQAQERKVVLGIDDPAQGLPDVRADHQQIKWVLTNLIENGLRYTPEGGSVRISFTGYPNRVQVSVRGYRHRHHVQGPEQHLRALLPRRECHRQREQGQRTRPLYRPHYRHRPWRRAFLRPE